MYEQRAEKDTDRFEPQGPWLPAGLPNLLDPAERARLGPWYVVVDEMHGGGCRFTIDLWPDVDADGRLVFETERTALQWVDIETAHDVIRQAREASADSPVEHEIAGRGLRIGDVFAVWRTAADRLGLTPNVAVEGTPPEVDPPGPTDAEPPGGLVDVTGVARVATRAAVDAVGAGELTETDLRRLGIPSSAVAEAPEA